MPQAHMRNARPKVQKVLGYISLSTATEAITFAFLLNKAFGLYGFLALFTGYRLNALQFSMYIYSIVIFFLGLHLARHIRRGSPFQTLCLTWLYILDTLLNIAYTTLFGIGWFKMLATNLSKEGSMDTTSGKASLIDTAHLKGDKKGKGRVIAAVPQAGSSAGHDPVSPTHKVDSKALSQAFMASGSFASITVLCLLYMVRLFFCYVLVRYSRELLRGNIPAPGATAAQQGNKSAKDGPSSLSSSFAGSSKDVAEDAASRQKGGMVWFKLGRALTAFPSRRFWLGAAGSDNEAWMRETGEKFRNHAER